MGVEKRQRVRTARDRDATIALGNPQAALVLRYRRHRCYKWKVDGIRLRGRAEFGNLCLRGVAFVKESRNFSLGKMLPAFRIA
jgi:hypothetical protein